jgi:hypothetical protein
MLLLGCFMMPSLVDAVRPREISGQSSISLDLVPKSQLTNLAIALNQASSALQDLNGTYQRWRDIAENTYSSSYQTNFSYGQTNVSLTYELSSPSFSGTFDATGLKPNFAYQLKLQGKPVEDPISDQHLRDVGRSYDVALNLTIGYVIFDFLITDRNGEAHCNFSLANSYHVLWKTSQRTPQPNDSVPKWRSVEGGPDDSPHAYTANVTPTAVGIYAEWEKGVPGNVSLPAGNYDVKFIITEESFHSSIDDVSGGYWSTVMGCDVNFTIIERLIHDVAVKNASLSKTVVGAGGYLRLNVTVENEGGFDEDLNLSMQLNSTFIEEQTFTSVAPRSTQAVAFFWNTTGFPRGNYVIVIQIGSVANETDTTDNSIMTSIIVSFPGDVDGNGSVDIFDALILASTFNSVPSDPKWIANADIDCDGFVGLYDAILLAGNYGRTSA